MAFKRENTVVHLRDSSSNSNFDAEVVLSRQNNCSTAHFSSLNILQLLLASLPLSSSLSLSLLSIALSFMLKYPTGY